MSVEGSDQYYDRRRREGWRKGIGVRVIVDKLRINQVSIGRGPTFWGSIEGQKRTGYLVLTTLLGIYVCDGCSAILLTGTKAVGEYLGIGSYNGRLSIGGLRVDVKLPAH